MRSMAEQVRAMLAFQRAGAVTFDYGNNIRAQAQTAGVADAFSFPGLPALICWLGYGGRARAGLEFNRLVASGELRAPIVIGRDHLDSGSVASPNRETEGMRDGSDAVSDWVFLNALANCAAGATWVSVHHGGGVGIGYSQHAGMVVVADGSEAWAGEEAELPGDLPRATHHLDAHGALVSPGLVEPHAHPVLAGAR